MLSKLLALIGLGGPENDGRVLARDTRAIIEMLHGQHGPDSLRRISGAAKTQIDEVHRRGLDDPQYYGRGIEALTELNRAARARRDNIAWSGITLAIIYVKAEMLGDFGLTARNAIDGYMGKWPPAEDVQNDTSGDPSEPENNR
jgi:hypothetical protein